jgi:Ca-activated chloride channel homolog
MADAFHFLRPWWLVALPIGVALILYVFRVHASGGGWRRVVDRALQPLVLTGADRYAGRRGPLIAALAAWAVATIALAGPTWERLPVPAFRSEEALVVALDLSRSMDAADLAPSRLSRAKLKLLSLLERRGGGQTGLVVFSAHAFTVTPLTTDTRTIASLVAALSTDIMPSRGTRIQAGLEKSAALLRQANVGEGRILLMTDAQPSRRDIEVARELRAQGFEVSVLAVGTADGAPIPERDGGFMTDGRGNVVVPRLDFDALGRLADAGGGRFSALTADDADLERLEPARELGTIGSDMDETRVAEVWRDAGFGFALVLLPLLALGFRRGWVAVLLCCVLVPLPEAGAQTAGGATTASAGVDAGLGALWKSFWRRPDQRGADALAEDRPELAAQLFDDARWRAAAQYRAGDYESSAVSLGGLDSADAHYNRGTALARAGNVQAAIEAYDRVLELEPDHEDARFNRTLLEELLEQNEPPPEQQQAAAGDEQNSDQGDGESQGDEAAGSEESGGEGSQQAQQSPGDAADGDSRDPGDPGGEDFADADRTRPEEGNDGRDGEGEPEQTDPRLAEAEGDVPEQSDDDLERWASDQAAEQWLRRIRQDPGGLLRRKFLYQYQRLGIDQDGNYVWPGDEREPW